MKFLCLMIAILFTQATYAEWKLETISGIQVHYYLPKNPPNLSGLSSLKKSLMINLHGCAQKPEDLKKDGNWDNAADDYNMVVALPRVPNGGVYSGCWDYYGADQSTTTKHSVEVLKLVQELLSRKDLNIDRDQVYVSGLSSGGGQSMVLGCLAPEVFAGMGLNAGPSTGSTAKEISRPSTPFEKMLATCKKFGTNKDEAFKTQLTSIIYGNNDYIVNTAFNTFNAEIMSTIYGANNKSTFDTKKLPGTFTEGTGTLWSDNRGPRVSLIMNTNLGHNWPAGQGGHGGSFINKKSINYPDYLASFFIVNNRRAKNSNIPEIMIDPIESIDSRFTITGKLNISTRLIKSLEVTVRKMGSDEIVDLLNLELNENTFAGTTKKLLEGEYDFQLEVKTKAGLSRIFKRNSWSGEVTGMNKPQLIGVRFLATNDCAYLNGQILSNGASAVEIIEAKLDEDETFTAPVENSLWKLEICGLSEGKHLISVYGKSISNTVSNIETFSFFSSQNAAIATLQDHMEAKRLKWKDYISWYKKYGSNLFTLYLGQDKIWREKSQR